LLPAIVPSVVIGLPIGVFVIRRMNHETFRRICMSFDAWVVAFGTSQALINLGVLPNPSAYIVLAVVAAIDLYLLTIFFGSRNSDQVLAQVRLGTS
jgi:uncharacterized protein